MSDNSAIEWTDASWNPILGCDRISPGCDRCYAITQATIRAGSPNPAVATAFNGLTARTDGRQDWTGKVNLLPVRLGQPLSWRKPKRIFVNSLADMFHKGVPDAYIAEVFAVMALAPQHTFQLLTKRHARMRSLLGSPDFRTAVKRAVLVRVGAKAPWLVEPWWPLRNVWVGVSVEDQKWADIRIPTLLDTPAAVRWISAEPLLGKIDITEWIGAADGRTEVPRGADARTGPVGRTGDRRPRQDMETGGTARESVGLRNTDHPMCTAEGGAEHRQISPDASDGRLGNADRDGASAGLVSPERSDPRGFDDQSQERNLVRQPSGEPGVGHLLAADCARPNSAASRAAQPERRAQLNGETDLERRGADSRSAGDRRTAGIDREGLPGSHAADLAHLPGRPSISWVVCGGESGPGARPMHPQWARDLRNQCVEAGVAYHFKQFGQFAPVTDRPQAGDRWLAYDGADTPWQHGNGHIREAGGDFRWPGTNTVLVRRARSKHDAGRVLDGRTWDEYPADRRAVSA